MSDPGRRTLVAIARRGDRFELLDQAAEAARFWPHLEAALAASGKPREGFVVAIKPNLMIFQNARVPEVATDPAMVEHLVRRLAERGFTTVKVVESQNTMGNWVRNRSVANVARVAGYTGRGYELVDLTLEAERHTYRARGMPDWVNYVGRSWRDADYRIDFAKLKTQLDNNYTLNLKNQFGVLPLQNKYWHYHTRLPYWACTLYTLVNFPVHFGFIDGWRASDGPLGFAVQYRPKQPEVVLAGESILALDVVGAGLMGMDPWESPLPRFALRQFGEPAFDVVGDDTPLADWENVPPILHDIVDVAQEVYLASNVGASMGLANLDTTEFPPRLTFMRVYYKVLNWLMLLIHGRLMPPRHRQLLHAVVEKDEARTARLTAKL